MSKKRVVLEENRRGEVGQSRLKDSICAPPACVQAQREGRFLRDVIAAEGGDSAHNVQRFICLTNLIPELLGLLDLADQKKISFNPAVERSDLTHAEQVGFFAGHGREQAPAITVL